MTGSKVDAEDFEELVRLERSTAELQGRDPNLAESIVRARLASGAQREERERRVAQTRDAVRAKQRASRMMAIKIGAAVIVLAAAAVPTSQMVLANMARTDALRSALANASAPALEAGFASKEQWLDVGQGGVELHAPAGTCSAVIAVREGDGEPVGIRVDRGALGHFEGPGGRVWCSCEAERAVVSVVEPNEARHAVHWLSVSAAAVGGLDVLGERAPSGFTVYGGEADRVCADAAFADWSQKEGHGDLENASADRAQSVAALEGLGFEFVGQLSRGRRFGVIRLKKNRCFLAIPVGPPSEVALRGQQGARLIEHTTHPLGWCTYGGDSLVSLWRDPDSAGEQLVLRVPAERIGGLIGLREAALNAGLDGFEIVADGALSVDDVAATLIASTVTESTIVKGTSRGIGPTPERKLVVFVSREGSALEPAGMPAVPMGCWPAADGGGPLHVRTCVQAAAQPWQVTGPPEAVAGAAADPPFWLMLLSDSTDPLAMTAAARSLALARHLSLLGFQPTTTAGVLDTPFGARVGGVVGTKEFVAFAVTKARPWIVPLSAGKPWTLDGPVHVTALDPEATVEVRAPGSLGADPAGRRVVVWRR